MDVLIILFLTVTNDTKQVQIILKVLKQHESKKLSARLYIH